MACSPLKDHRQQSPGQSRPNAMRGTEQSYASVGMSNTSIGERTLAQSQSHCAIPNELHLLRPLGLAIRRLSQPRAESPHSDPFLGVPPSRLLHLHSTRQPRSPVLSPSLSASSLSATNGDAQVAALEGETNRLLRALPTEIYAQLQPYLVDEDVQNGRVLWEPGEPIPSVYFPRTCVLSLVVMLEDGFGVEAGTVGREGMAGIAIALGADSMVPKGLAQVPGRVASVPAPTFRALLAEYPAMMQVVLRYAQAMLDETSQS